MFLLYHAYVYLEFLILACTIYILAPVYKRLIKMVSKKDNVNVIDALIKVYNSFISEKIDDYNSSLYYENPSYIFTCYEENKMI